MPMNPANVDQSCIEMVDYLSASPYKGVSVDLVDVQPNDIERFVYRLRQLVYRSLRESISVELREDDNASNRIQLIARITRAEPPDDVFQSDLHTQVHTTPSRSLYDDLRETIERMYHKSTTDALFSYYRKLSQMRQMYFQVGDGVSHSVMDFSSLDAGTLLQAEEYLEKAITYFRQERDDRLAAACTYCRAQETGEPDDRDWLG